jgi:hypothetical protein
MPLWRRIPRSEQARGDLGDPAPPAEPLQLRTKALHLALVRRQPQHRAQLMRPHRMHRIGEHLHDVRVGTRQRVHPQLRRPGRHQTHPDRRADLELVRLHRWFLRRPGLALRLHLLIRCGDRPVPGQDLGHRLPSDLQPGHHAFLLGQLSGQLLDLTTQFQDPLSRTSLPPLQLLQPRHHRRPQETKPWTRRSTSRATSKKMSTILGKPQSRSAPAGETPGLSTVTSLPCPENATCGAAMPP